MAEKNIAIEYPLSAPIKAHGEEVSTLTFREPTAADIIAVGNPVIFDPSFSPPRITHSGPLMSEMMGRLAAIPPSSVALMQTEDWTSCAWQLTPFFVPMRRAALSPPASD